MKLNQYEWDSEKDLIAEGAFAEVFKARDSNNKNRFVALKIYKEGVAKGTTIGSLDNKYTLEKEFRKVDGLSHSNIISYYGLDYIQYQDALGRTASYPVIIMEYASEGTLLEFLTKRPDEITLEKIIINIIEGVDYLHNEGTIHRDLKPGNILITKNRRGDPIAKITDFGISRDTIEENLEQSQTEGVGTPHYMAPEQFYKKRFGFKGEVSERTDIWAIGIIVYRILTGRRPFGHESKDYEQIRDAIVNSTPDFSLIPEKYSVLVSSCLEKMAEKRPANASLLLNKIRQPPVIEDEATVIFPLQEEDVTVVAPPLKTKPEKKNTTKNRKIPVIIGLVVVLVIAGVFFSGEKEETEEIAELAVVKLDDKFGYIDIEGNKVIPFEYDAAWCITEGMGLVQSNGKWGFIDENGNIIINLIYDDANSFSENLASVKKDGKWGFINKTGEIEIPFTYDGARSFSDGLAPVKIDESWGYINKENTTIVPPTYQSAYPFSESLAVVRLMEKEGFINHNGEVVIPATYDFALKFSEGLAAVSKDRKWGFIDKTGNEKIPLTFEYTWGFSDDLAAVALEGKWGFINKNGEFTIAPKYEDASGFSNGLSGVRLNGKEGFINKEEKIIIPFSYDYADTFCNVAE